MGIKHKISGRGSARKAPPKAAPLLLSSISYENQPKLIKIHTKSHVQIQTTPSLARQPQFGATPVVEPPEHPHAACPRIWWGSEIPVDAYTYASSGRTANPPKIKNPQITTDLAHIKTARCWGHGDLIPHGPEAGNRNRRP